MWMNYKQYRYSHLIDEILSIAQQELREYLKNKNQYDMAPLEWFEKQYGQELPHRDILKLWWTVPSIRAGKYTEWAPLMPTLSEAAYNLPGIINFSLNCISPGGAIPEHSDYSYDMREDLAKSKEAFVILVAVDIPSNDIDLCGFELNGIKTVIKTGDIKAFDGSLPHSAWNYTNEWRYTINMDLKREYWDA